jgi:hypothetical protein
MHPKPIAKPTPHSHQQPPDNSTPVKYKCKPASEPNSQSTKQSVNQATTQAVTSQETTSNQLTNQLTKQQNHPSTPNKIQLSAIQ